MKLLAELSRSDIIALGALLVTVIGAIASIIVAWKYSDVAAGKAAKKYAEEQAKNARTILLKTLLNVIGRIRVCARHNSNLQTERGLRPPVNLPTAAFEAAFFSKEAVLLVDPETVSDSALLDCVTYYLAIAEGHNAMVEADRVLRSSSAINQSMEGYTTQIEQGFNDSFTELINQLEEHLRTALTT
jgi:hypothetical protein